MGRRKRGLPLLVDVGYLKHKVKNDVQFIDNYEHDGGKRSAPPGRRRAG